MMRLALLCLLCWCLTAEAAPIPKSLKRQKIGGDPNGVWELTKFNSNGQSANHEGMAKLWEIDGELFYVGIPSPDDRGQTSGGTLKITNTDDTDFRLYREHYRSRLKVSGDELCWVYTSDKTVELAECEPGPNRFYYEFKRVK